MNSTEELFDIVDDADCVVGSAPRTVAHRDGLRHRAVHVFLFNRQAQLYLQKRSGFKDTYPGRFDSSASGHVDHGESYDACAIRELGEELALGVAVEALTKHFKASACLDTGWEFVWLYSLMDDRTPRPNPAEIEAGKFWSRPELVARVAAAPADFAPSFRLLLAEFIARGLWPAPH